MISASDTDPSSALSTLSSLGLSTSFLVPTDTAMGKSIIDATYPVRKYLRDNKFHDYAVQDQGEDAKVLKDTAFFVEATRLEQTNVSMYRPATKLGDPRIWFYRLKSYAEPFNLLALVVLGERLYVINCSRPEIIASLQDGSNPIFSQEGLSVSGLSHAAEELLGKLTEIGSRGWISSQRVGDTGVGFTLESLLGISANSSKAPDYKGVEIKSGRAESSNQSLFAKTPDWKKSNLKDGLQLLNKRGRISEEKQRLQLFHSIYAPFANSYGLQLEVDHEEGLLRQYCNVAGRREDDVLWELGVLQDALRKKHGETFWVKSHARKTSAIEEFKFYQATYTRGPNIGAFPLLLEAGEVFLDYTMWAPSPGKQKNKGFLFRMKQVKLELLFGRPKVFKLAA